ncbi:uncharacterized protein LOC115388988 isoform X2 [Salarias fasciatus]|uniref:uncharacterized protein LOC115388988 isoform X2 n=1 Tax=Salarias fasciatus TaxID=181472 RepID=UPI001176F4B7|nr:uncharacterized protein LOC115388988 isoform X2 [Salarias fasciatus]
MVAHFLLESYKRCKSSTPRKTQSSPPALPVSSIKEESDHDHIHSMSIKEESPDEGEASHLRITVIDMDDSWNDPGNVKVEDSSDEDFVPSLHLRTVGAKMDNLEELTVDEAVLDFDMPDPSPDLDTLPDDQTRVETEDDLIGKKANITYNDNLLSLVSCLRLPVQNCKYVDKVSGASCPGVQPFRVDLKPRGTGVVLYWYCTYNHLVWSWNSQPTLRFKMQGGDFMLSTNILLSGNDYREVALMFKFMEMGMVSESTFFRIQDSYCKGPILKYWEKTRAEVIQRLRQKEGVVLLSDGRMDSPGHCANFCTYTTIEQESRDIVYIDSIDKRMCGGDSVVMERECFCRSMDALLPDLKIKEMVTDDHPEISALLHPEQGKYKGIQHSVDIWHAAKSLSKKMRQAGTEKKQKEILLWSQDILNHFWYCSKQAKTEEHFKMMWAGVMHHVCNKHSWDAGSCEHEPLADDSQDKPWMTPGSEAHQVLAGIVLEKQWLTQVKKFINFRSTSDLESFQNHVMMYTAKRMSYTLDIYKARTCLAAIDYNKHNRRGPARNKDGHKMYRKSYNKKTTTWSVYTMKEKKSYSYIPEIQRAILSMRLRSGKGLPRRATTSPDDPEHLGLIAPVESSPTSELVILFQCQCSSHDSSCRSTSAQQFLEDWEAGNPWCPLKNSLQNDVSLFPSQRLNSFLY